MAKYTLYFDKFNDVVRWKNYEENPNLNKPKECIAIQFNLRGIPTKSFPLENLDALTSRYKDSMAFYKALSSLNVYNDILIDVSKKEFLIIYKHKGEYRKHDIIFNNELIKTMASQVIEGKKQGKKESEIKLPLTKELDLYIEKIKRYALNDPNFITSRLINFKLKEYLEEYVNLKKNDYLEPEQIQLVNELNEKIRNSMRTYKTLRKMVVWERKYLNEKQNHIEKNNDYQQTELEIEKNIDSAENDDRIVEMIDVEDDNLMMWYKLGFQEGGHELGLEKVYENVSDIYSYPTDELERIGIAKKR